MPVTVAAMAAEAIANMANRAKSRFLSYMNFRINQGWLIKSTARLPASVITPTGSLTCKTRQQSGGRAMAFDGLLAGACPRVPIRRPGGGTEGGGGAAEAAEGTLQHRTEYECQTSGDSNQWFCSFHMNGEKCCNSRAAGENWCSRRDKVSWR